MLLFRNLSFNFDSTFIDAVSKGNLQDVQACLNHHISPNTYKLALDSSVYHKRPNIFLFLINNLPFELAQDITGILEKLINNVFNWALGDHNTSMVYVILNNLPAGVELDRLNIVERLLQNALNKAASDNDPSMVNTVLESFEEELQVIDKAEILKNLLVPAAANNNIQFVSFILITFSYVQELKSKVQHEVFKWVKSVELANAIQLALNFSNEELTELLFSRVSSGNDNLVEWLCIQGADVNAAKYAQGFLVNSVYTPLMWAVYFKNELTIAILCKFGADIEKQAFFSKVSTDSDNCGPYDTRGSALDLAGGAPIRANLINILESQKTLINNVHTFFADNNINLSTEVEGLINAYCGYPTSQQN